MPFTGMSVSLSASARAVRASRRHWTRAEVVDCSNTWLWPPPRRNHGLPAPDDSARLSPGRSRGTAAGPPVAACLMQIRRPGLGRCGQPAGAGSVPVRAECRQVWKDLGLRLNAAGRLPRRSASGSPDRRSRVIVIVLGRAVRPAWPGLGQPDRYADPGRPARRGDLRHPPRAAPPPRRYRTPALVRLWSLAMQRRPAPLGCLQLGIVALAPAGTVRCPVMPPWTVRRITAMSRHRDHLRSVASSMHFYGMRETPAISLRDRGLAGCGRLPDASSSPRRSSSWRRPELTTRILPPW